MGVRESSIVWLLVSCFILNLGLGGFAVSVENLVVWSSFWGCDYMGFVFVNLTVFVVVSSVLCMGSVVNCEKDGFNFIFCVFSVGILCVMAFVSVNWFVFVTFFEGSLIPISFLVLGWGSQPERLQGFLQMVVYTVVGGLPSLLVLVLIYNELCTANMEVLSCLKNFWYFDHGIIWFFLISGMLVKTPLYLLHGWLIKVHVEAPAAGSMMLSGVLLKLSAFGFWRFLYSFGGVPLWLCVFLGVFGVFGALMCGMVCFCCHDIKLIIAYSSVVHMGLNFVGLVCGLQSGWSGAVCAGLVHGLCSSFLFLMSGVLYSIFGSRSIKMCKGLGLLHPILKFYWFVVCAINMGAPPFLSFFGECFLFFGLLGWQMIYFLLLVVLVIVSGGLNMFLFSGVSHGWMSSMAVGVCFINVRDIVCCMVISLGLVLSPSFAGLFLSW